MSTPRFKREKRKNRPDYYATETWALDFDITANDQKRVWATVKIGETVDHSWFDPEDRNKAYSSRYKRIA